MTCVKFLFILSGDGNRNWSCCVNLDRCIPLGQRDKTHLGNIDRGGVGLPWCAVGGGGALKLLGVEVVVVQRLLVDGDAVVLLRLGVSVSVLPPAQCVLHTGLHSRPQMAGRTVVG